MTRREHFRDTVIACIVAYGVAGSTLLFPIYFAAAKGYEMLKQMESKQSDLELVIENNIGQDIPEKFYQVNGHKAYVEIDGMPVDAYFSK